MQRRRFLHASTVLTSGMLFTRESQAAPPPPRAPMARSYSLTGDMVRIYCERIREPVRITMLADTHLGLRDEREKPFRRFSGRMAGAYVKTRHVSSLQPTTPRECFVEGIAAARKLKADLLALPGDILSFPSEANVEWVAGQLTEAAIPFLYTAGNHDWHYEGMEGTSRELRDRWIQKRLLPLYQGRNPLVTSKDINGLRVIFLDNSTYEILPEQLETFLKLLEADLPVILFVHIPLYAPGRAVGFGCGHPQWNAASDRSFEIERRPRWPESGHTRTTLDFHREVFAASNLLAVFAGHTHQASVDLLQGIPQLVTDDNASGGRLDIELLPMAKG